MWHPELLLSSPLYTRGASPGAAWQRRAFPSSRRPCVIREGGHELHTLSPGYAVGSPRRSLQALAYPKAPRVAIVCSSGVFPETIMMRRSCSQGYPSRSFSTTSNPVMSPSSQSRSIWASTRAREHERTVRACVRFRDSHTGHGIGSEAHTHHVKRILLTSSLCQSCKRGRPVRAHLDRAPL